MKIITFLATVALAFTSLYAEDVVPKLNTYYILSHGEVIAVIDLKKFDYGTLDGGNVTWDKRNTLTKYTLTGGSALLHRGNTVAARFTADQIVWFGQKDKSK